MTCSGVGPATSSQRRRRKSAGKANELYPGADIVIIRQYTTHGKAKKFVSNGAGCPRGCGDELFQDQGPQGLPARKVVSALRMATGNEAGEAKSGRRERKSGQQVGHEDLSLGDRQ